jgi:hypothetical protein
MPTRLLLIILKHGQGKFITIREDKIRKKSTENMSMSIRQIYSPYDPFSPQCNPNFYDTITSFEATIMISLMKSIALIVILFQQSESCNFNPATAEGGCKSTTTTTSRPGQMRGPYFHV